MGPPGDLGVVARFDAFFTGHMPLSYWMRWPVLEVFGSATARLRLHAAVGFALAAGVTASRQPAGDCCRDACGALTGREFSRNGERQLRLDHRTRCGGGRGVSAALRHRWWWVAGLALAALNDLYALWLGIGAMVALVMVHRGERERLVRPLGVLAVLTVPLVVWVLIRMGFAGEAASVGMHADVASSDSSLWSLWTGRLQRFGGASLGYAAGREPDFWEQWPSIALPWSSPSARSGPGRPGHGRRGGFCSEDWSRRWWRRAAGSLDECCRWSLACCGLGPALALCTAATVSSLERGRALVLGTILSATGTATLVQQLTRSTLHTDAAMFVADHAEPGDVVVAPERIRTRLLTAGVSQAMRCIEGMPESSQTVWWIQAQPIQHPFAWQACDDARGDHAPVDMTGWRIAQVGLSVHRSMSVAPQALFDRSCCL